ncbi:hypothetical protein [Bacillus solimangrovi]|nr:hypothetical protein [Bacillus solimangrovi]
MNNGLVTDKDGIEYSPALSELKITVQLWDATRGKQKRVCLQLQLS